MKQSLRQRWEESMQLLFNDLQIQFRTSGKASQSVAEPSDNRNPQPSVDTATTKAISMLSNQWFEKVTAMYNEPHRAYHNMTHVEDVLSSLDYLMEEEDVHCNEQASVDVAITTFAAFFHDVVYNPKSATNEKDSAELFVQFASALWEVVISLSSSILNEETATAGIRAEGMSAKIEECIIATATHINSSTQANETNNILLATFLDADMSTLGRSEEAYDKYAGCIRKEYVFVERDVYCQKRAEILESFLPIEDDEDTKKGDTGSADVPTSKATSSTEGTKKQHEFIYATKKGREQWETQARRNLKREIGMLRQGIIPCEDEG